MNEVLHLPQVPGSFLEKRYIGEEGEIVPGKIDLTARVSVPTHVAFNELAGEAVLLNLESGKYYGLDEVGTRMFTLLKGNGRLDLAAHALVQEYDVTEEQLQGDLMKLVDDLVAHGLLTVDVA